MNKPELPDPLVQALADWRVNPARNPEFRGAVWKQIGAESRTISWMAYLRAQPLRVTGLLAIAVVIGAIAGRDRARARVDRDREHLADSYVQAMDARTMRMP